MAKTHSKKSVKPAQAIELMTLAEKVEAALARYLDTTGAILDDYLVPDGAITELAAADEKLRAELVDLVEDLGEPSYNELLEKVSESEDFDSDDLLEMCDADDVKSWAISNNYCLIKLGSISDRDKLEEFVTRELYPNYNEQRKSLVI